MTGYPVVRKTAQHAPALAELEFAMHTPKVILVLGERSLIGASRRGLGETFNHDRTEHDKVMRCFTDGVAG